MPNFVVSFIRKHILNKSVLTHFELLRARAALLATPRDKVEDIVAAHPDAKIGQSRVAIVAVYQNRTPCRNLCFLLDTLRERGYATLVFNNGRLDLPRALRERVTLYWERAGGKGRDFASYQTGVAVLRHWIERGIADPQTILFANDSIFYVPGSFENFLTRFDETPADWSGVTESRELSYHVSSWFFSVSRSAWNHPGFQRYWSEYLPLHARPHAILNGEVGFSTLMTSIGYVPTVHFPASYFIQQLSAFAPADFFDKLSLLPQGFAKHYLENSSKWGLDSLSARAAVTAKITIDQENTNQSAFWQLFGLLHGDFPFIKKDIYSRQVFGLTQLRRFVPLFVECFPEGAYCFERVMKAVDARSLTGIKKLRWQYNLD